MDDEYISKQSVIDYLNGYLHSIGECGADSLFDRGQRRALINSIQDISAVKATDVRPLKQGHWIEINEYGGWGDTHYRCSVCGNEWGLDAEKWNGCPICLARMDGDKNG